MIFSGIIIASALFMAVCGPVIPNKADEYLSDVTYIVYSPEEKSMTIYLDGNVPVTNRQSRAINLELAKMGHNFFEVVFVYNPGDDEENLVSRACWSLGDPAGITDLYRTSYGVDYSSISPNPPEGFGSSLLFVGTGADRTLLALGRLSKVDDLPVDDSSPDAGKIFLVSKSVTFDVFSLEAGVHMDADKSSFLTAANGDPSYHDVSPDNTWIESKILGQQAIPYYRIIGGTLSDPGPNIWAKYNFTMSGDADIEDYLPSILLADAGEAGKKQPRYTLNNGAVYMPTGDIDTRTIIHLLNNLAPDEPFSNPVEFLIDVVSRHTTDGSSFALVFSVPVYALTREGGAVIWHIRPGFGTFMYDLDTGREDGGGAIFMGTGDLVVITEDIQISIQMPPDKYKYNVNGNMEFSIEGLVVWLENSYRDHIRTIDNNQLTFYIGSTQIIPGNDMISGLTGLIPVTVSYTDPDTGITREDTYYILVGDSQALTIKTKAVYESWDWYDANSLGMTDRATVVMVVMNSIDIPDVSMNGEYRTLLIVAGAESITIGRGGNQSTTIVDGLASFILDNTWTVYSYLGTWPFNDTLSVNVNGGGTATYEYGGTHAFSVNAGGSYSRNTAIRPLDPVSPDLPNFMFRFQRGPGAVIVWMGEGLTVHNEDLLFYH